MNEMRLRNQKPDVQGRSLILNALAVVFNLLGVYLVVHGFLLSEEGNMITQISGIVLIAGTIFLMVILKGMLLFSYVARILVGGLFIVSGLIKANDPWGFAFKLEEYFAPGGLSTDVPFFEAFTPFVLELSILICVAEIVLGVAVLIGGKIKLASWLLLFMMLFFTWLTYYTHNCNESQLAAMELGEEYDRVCVTDCGCFGDALRGSVGRSLTPLESFWKDLVLLYFVLIIFLNQRRINLNTIKENWIIAPAGMVVVGFFSWVFGWYFPIIFYLILMLGSFVVANLNIGNMAKPWKMAIYVTLVTFIFSMYTSMYLPIKDYRPYKIGNNIFDQMNNGIPRESEWVFLYTNKETGEIERFAADQYEIYGDTNKYEWYDREETIIVEGKDPSITDFSANINYEYLTEKDKKNKYIDSIIQADYDFYYEPKLVIQSLLNYPNDTISVWDYDTLIYPDSLYRKGPEFVSLIDPTDKFDLDLTNYLITVDYVLIMTIRDIHEVKERHMDDFKALYAAAEENGIPFVVLCPATREEIAEFKAKYDFDPLFLTFDGTEVKIIVRSNPGLVLLNKGTILDKWPSRSIPDFEWIADEYLQLSE